MKARSGYAFARRAAVWVRVTWTNSHGTRCGIVRKVRALTKAEAGMARDALGKRLARDLAVRKKLAEILKETERRTEGDVVETFGELADRFIRDYAKDAVTNTAGKKTGGMRSGATVRAHVAMLRRHFGDARQLRRITHDDIRALKEKRLATTTKQNAERTPATVNRELSVLRRMLNIAVTNEWIEKSPFRRGESLISNSEEPKRERILTREEEARLLLHCSAAPRRHILPVVIAALDTAARRGELLTLKWRDVDMKAGTITFLARHTKTERQRIVAVTDRLRRTLEVLARESGQHPGSLVFGISASLRRAFNSAKRLAGLDNVRFHDLRHTAATRLTRGGLSLAEVGRQLGHTQAETTFRYVNADEETRGQAFAILNEYDAPIDVGETPAVVH